MHNTIKFFRIYLTIILILSFQHSMGQNLVLIDSETHKPIPFANIISNDGKLVGLSDINGALSKTKLLKYNNQLTIQHVSYENCLISSKLLEKKDTIEMNKRQNLLPEIMAIPGKNKAYDYTVLTGYYRCYQLEDSIAKYYKDRIIEFYIPKAGKDIKRIILNSRSFQNKELIEKQKARKLMVTINGVVIPYLESGTILNELNHQYSTKTQNNEQLIIKSDSIVGTIRTDKNNGLTNINVDMIAPMKEEIHSLFNYSSRITNINISENYSGEDISSITKSDLESRKEYRKLFFKHKKDKAETAIDIISELYIVNKDYATKNEYKKRKNISNQSNSIYLFSNEYWNDLSKYNIPQLGEPIQILLNNKLIKE